MTNINDRKIGRIAKFALAIFVLFGASQSYAACAQSDMAGTWYFTGVTGDTFYAEFWETDFCKVRVNSVGNIVGSSSQCQFRDDLGKGNLNITGGNLTVNSSCAITGKIKYNVEGFIANLNIDSAQLDKGKTVITMVGRLSVDPDIVSSFTGVKK